VTLPAFVAARRAAETPLLLSAGQQSIDVLPAGHSASNPPFVPSPSSLTCFCQPQYGLP